MDKIAKGMSEAGHESTAVMTRPRKGERYRCDGCGMQIQVTADCKCNDDHAHFRCCGQEMEKL